jgi:sugar O-acyltransferase (sialic acid O-acetyltransferase NeuD family)
VVIELLRRQERPPEVVAVLDSSPEGTFVGRQLAGIRVEGHIGGLPGYVDRADGVIPAVGDGAERARVAAAAADLGLGLMSAIHPDAIVARGSIIGPGTVVGAGAIIGVGAEIGRGVIINSGAIVEHHCRVGHFAHVAPGATLAGGVEVGEFAWIGVGSTVLEDIVIGREALVGAASMVNRDVEASTTVYGVPARPRPQPPSNST